MRARILHVEDNPAYRMLVHDLLEFHGYIVIDVSDSDAAVEATNREGPDLILVGIQHSAVDRFKGIRRMKVDGRLRRIPVVAITSSGRGDEQDQIPAGYDACIARPYRTQELLHLIETLLRANPVLQ